MLFKSSGQLSKTKKEDFPWCTLISVLDTSLLIPFQLPIKKKNYHSSCKNLLIIDYKSLMVF